MAQERYNLLLAAFGLPPAMQGTLQGLYYQAGFMGPRMDFNWHENALRKMYPGLTRNLQNMPTGIAQAIRALYGSFFPGFGSYLPYNPFWGWGGYMTPIFVIAMAPGQNMGQIPGGGERLGGIAASMVEPAMGRDIPPPTPAFQPSQLTLGTPQDTKFNVVRGDRGYAISAPII